MSYQPDYGQQQNSAPPPQGQQEPYSSPPPPQHPQGDQSQYPPPPPQQPQQGEQHGQQNDQQPALPPAQLPDQQQSQQPSQPDQQPGQQLGQQPVQPVGQPVQPVQPVQSDRQQGQLQGQQQGQPQGQQQQYPPAPGQYQQGQTQQYPPPPGQYQQGPNQQYQPQSGQYQQGQNQQYQPQPGQYQQGPNQQYPPPPGQQQNLAFRPGGGPGGAPGITNFHAPPSKDIGSFQGGSYNVAHRDTNAVLNIELLPGGAFRSRSGAMIHMAGTIQIEGQVKFNFKKLLTGGSMAESTYTGNGRVALGPTLFGDIISLQIEQGHQWTIGKDAFLAATPQVYKETKSQGFGKAMFSGEDLFVYQINGQGMLWLTSFGAVDRLDLQQGEQHIVDNGHLVAWNCEYRIERSGGSAISSLKSGEGMVCRFFGPGTVYIQTRNSDEFESYIRGLSGGR